MILNCMTLPTGNYLGARLDISQSSVHFLRHHAYLQVTLTFTDRFVLFQVQDPSAITLVSSSRLLFYCIVLMCNFRAIQKMISFLFM